ncbi:polysaccharide deacetylase family protein [Rhodococcus sp. NPDC127528]|uniref:polysaccharide deacetylase family protein n=1 Tax=Rhodococcus sp. NPDC127528 TaxID=3345395 RepID=UPI00362B2CC4
MGEDGYWISVDEFHRILDEIMTWPRVEISFDDGNASDAQIALAALEQRNLTARFFILAGRFGAAGSLTEVDVRELRRRGMTIGTHGMDHQSWRGMTPSIRDRELVEARHRIADAAGGPIDEAAVPLGRYDRRLLADLRGLGYTAVHTSDRRAARVGSWIQPRFSVRRGDTAQTLRDDVLTESSLIQTALLAGKGVVKRLR